MTIVELSVGTGTALVIYNPQAPDSLTADFRGHFDLHYENGTSERMDYATPAWRSVHHPNITFGSYYTANRAQYVNTVFGSPEQDPPDGYRLIGVNAGFSYRYGGEDNLPVKWMVLQNSYIGFDLYYGEERAYQQYSLWSQYGHVMPDPDVIHWAHTPDEVALRATGNFDLQGVNTVINVPLPTKETDLAPGALAYQAAAETVQELEASKGVVWHLQSTPSYVWTITHNLGYNPKVMVFDFTGEIVDPGVVGHQTNNSLSISFDPSFAGMALLI